MIAVYHTNALALLASKPDASNLDSMIRGEERLGIKLPAAVREFYSSSALTTMVGREGGDQLIPMETPSHARACAVTTEHASDCDILVFMSENQGVFLWGAVLDGSEDPPVVVRQNLKHAPWISCCGQFSKYIYTRVFENQFWSTDHGRGINCALECFARLSAADLEFLRARCCEEPQTFGWPTIIYRFSSGWGMRVTIYDSDFGATVAIMANDAAGFQRLKELLRPLWDFSSSV